MKFEKNSKILKETFSDVLIEIAKKNEKIIVLDSDLAKASGLESFKNEHPKRFFNCGIQEANMVGVAAGLSSMGFIVLVHSFAAFAGRRAVDQIFMSGVYSKQNIKILATDAGICNGANGGTHMALEDIGIMRSLSEITIIDITDEVMVENILPQIMNTYGMYYVRLFRKMDINIYNKGETFEIGKAKQIRDGKHITIISSGSITITDSLKATEILEEQGFSVRLIDMFTIKPLDREAVIRSAKDTGAILTVENHNILNGLGSAVAEVLAEECLGVPFARMGIKDRTGEIGDLNYLKEIFGISTMHIVEEAKKIIFRKK